MEIIPAIDIIDGKCVRLTQGDYNQIKEYNSDPLQVAQLFEDAGIRRLHLVDLDGARQKKIVNLKVLEKIASKTSLHIDFGGGVQSNLDLEMAFQAGAKQVTGGSVAVKDPALFDHWIEEYGAEKIILGADVKNQQIAVHGWQERTNWYIYDFIDHWIKKGIFYTICTDVAKDGLLKGPAVDLYRTINEKFPELRLIASGGVSQIQDVQILSECGVYGVIIGKAIYEGSIKLSELQVFL